MKKTYSFDAECLALTSIAWAGAHQDEYNPVLTQQKLQDGLSKSPITANKLDKIVWGPAVYRVPDTRSDSDNRDDYMFFVVQNRTSPTDYRIACRSTVSSFDGQRDIEVIEMVDWREFDPRAPQEAKIASGMAIVLRALLTMTASVEPGVGTTLLQFLNTRLRDDDTLTFCGHSMGGTFTIPWGMIIKQQLTPNSRVQVRSFAGATAGNAAFATHAVNELGNGLKRIVNNKDIVPKAWNSDSLKEIATIYESAVTLPAPLKWIILAFAELLKGHAYTQAGPAESFGFGVKEDLKFKDQYDYQHGTAYLEYYDLEDGKDIIVETD